MNLEERAGLWKRAWKAAIPQRAFNELAKSELHPTLPYIGYNDHCPLSPLGISLLYNPQGDDAVKTLLERGASPNEPAEELRWRGRGPGNFYDAFQFACNYKIPEPFRLMLEYATPRTTDGLTPEYLLWVDAKHARTASLVCLGWLFTQMHRDDFIEPIVQLVADIPLDSWAAPRPMSPSRKKLK
jgi:hypothetical protein